MDFTSMIKESLNEKYSLMLQGKTKEQGVKISVKSAKEFLNTCKMLSNQIKSENNKSEHLPEKSLNQSSQTKKRKLVDFFQILACFSPIILSVILGIILFSNIQQIKILYNFTGWCIGWVVFTLASLITTFMLMNKRHEDWSNDAPAKKTSAIVVAVIVGVCAIIGFSLSAQLSPKFDPTTFVTLQATSKNTTNNGNGLNSTIIFDMKNVGPVKINYIFGEMKFYNNDTEIKTVNVYFQGDFESGREYNMTLNISDDQNNPIHNTSFENLRITYRITAMKFKDEFQEYTLNGHTFVVKEIDVNY